MVSGKKRTNMEMKQRKRIQRKKQKARKCLAWLLMVGTLTCLLGGGLLLLPEQVRYAEASEDEPENNMENDVEDAVENDAENTMETEFFSAWSPDAIERDVDFELTGERDAWYQDGSGLLWIRTGTALYAKPKAGSGYDAGAVLENIQTDGTFTFHLREEGDDGSILRESAAASVDYRVDGDAPGARFLISGSCQDGIYYNTDSCTVLLYMEPDGESGLKRALCKIASCDSSGCVADGTEASAWTECSSGSILEITEKGMFRIYVKTEDMVGNVNFSGSDVFCID